MKKLWRLFGLLGIHVLWISGVFARRRRLSGRPSSQRQVEALAGGRKINEFVYELFKPPGDRTHTLDIVLIHGLQFGDYRTWGTLLLRNFATALPQKAMLAGGKQGFFF
ncbi:hypothetical protein WJX75_002079 [Coccomyxa subellipsoidea]|uniref:Uncharacterized protein n=1 Tax=Coccomyxa subellipsoidea TaxID=248742 RepID=A0ABR2YDN6_9CHLO